MAHDEAAAGLLQHLTDTHLADRARLGEVVAFDELVHRHADVVARFAAVVTADEALVPEITARAFTDLFDQIGCGGYSIDDPFLPGLLRSTRALARMALGAVADGAPRPRPPAGAEVYDDLTGAAVWRLDEPERSLSWLGGVLGMDEHDLALTLDLGQVEVATLAERSAERLGSRGAAAHGLLASIEADLPPETADRARATWRRWVATVADLPGRHEARASRTLLTRLEPVTTKILRGAAVLLLVVGGAGIVFNGDGDDSGPGPGRSGGEELASSRGGDDRAEGSSGSIDAADAGGGNQASTSGQASSRRDAGGERGDAARSKDRSGSTSPSTAAGAGRSGGSGTTGSAGSTGSTPTAGATRPTGSPGGSPTGPGTAPGAPSITPPSATPPAPNRPTPPTPATPPRPTSPAPNPPPAAPTPPAAPNPPPPVTPATPIAPIVEIVTGVVGVVPPTIGGLGGLGGN